MFSEIVTLCATWSALNPKAFILCFSSSISAFFLLISSVNAIVDLVSSDSGKQDFNSFIS